MGNQKFRIRLRGGLEFDALTEWKRVIHFAPGERRMARRQYNRRLRQAMKKHIAVELMIITA